MKKLLQKTTSQHLEQIRYNVDNTIDFLQKYKDSVNEEIQFFKLNIKLPF